MSQHFIYSKSLQTPTRPSIPCPCVAVVKVFYSVPKPLQFTADFLKKIKNHTRQLLPPGNPGTETSEATECKHLPGGRSAAKNQCCGMEQKVFATTVSGQVIWGYSRPHYGDCWFIAES